LVERALETELSTHLGYGKHELRPEGQSNSRNGYSQKKVQGDFGIAEIAVPRDRQGEFEPQMVKKGQSRLSGRFCHCFTSSITLTFHGISEMLCIQGFQK